MRPRIKKLLRRVLFASSALVALWLLWEYLMWPDVDAVRTSSPSTTSYIELHRQRERQAGRDDRVDQRWVPYDRISPRLKLAVVAAEDINFFGHNGFAVEEIRAAVREAVEDLEFPRGASTITQQLARNLWLSASVSPLRKIREAILTSQLENRLGKRRILELYLNVVEFGPDIYGAEAASWHYFGKPASDVDEEEAAQLAAGLPRPRRWNPSSRSKAYRRRAGVILGRMEQANWLRNLIERNQ